MKLTQAIGAHYARYLGEPTNLYEVNLKAHPEGRYQITEYRDRPWSKAVTIATLGFSEVPLHMFRQELLFVCEESFVSEDLFELTSSVATIIADSQHPLLQGNILGPAGPVLEC